MDVSEHAPRPAPGVPSSGGGGGALTSSLEEAQEARLARICDKLELRPSDHLLEIGTGWDAMAVYAAARFG